MLPSIKMLRPVLPAALIVASFAFTVAVTVPSTAAPGEKGDKRDKTNSYQVTNLVSLSAAQGGTIAAPFHDDNLKNGWGVAFNPGGFVWVSDNGTGKSTLYDGTGKPSGGPLVVTIPAATAGDTGSPTGIVFNASNDFVMCTTPPPVAGQPPVPQPAKFLWASEDGVISGWNPNCNATNALKALVANAVYKGIAIAGNGSAHFMLYAADFIGNKVDVYDSTFNSVPMAAGAFVDPTIPADYGPFNIMNIDGNLYVAFAKTQPNDEDEAHGPGLGFVDVFDADGVLLMQLDGKKNFNAPWGIALAPQGFGQFSNDVLVGNFGDGRINAFDPQDGHFKGHLKTPDGQPLAIDGLWGIQFGNGILSQQTDTLFFAAGPNDEEDGVYGRIDLAPPAKGPAPKGKGK